MRLRLVLVSCVLLLLIVITVGAEQYSNVASVFELGMGARSLAIGGAFVGLADDGNALFYNPAGLAWTRGLSVLSSYDSRPGTTSYGSISASLPHLGFGVHYFDFGDVPETDEFGNVVGTFSYRNYELIAGAGFKASDLPFLAQMPMAPMIGFGIGVKFLKISTLQPGSGSGFAIDLPLLFCSESALSIAPIITAAGIGLVFENLISLPIEYGSGHEESWTKDLILGTSLEFLDKLILALDITSEKIVHLGMEWTPISVVSLRAGLRYEDLWMWSLGIGTRFRNFAFDLAAVLHPYLNSQLRGSLTVSW